MRLKKLLNEGMTVGQSAIDGKTKNSAKNFLYKQVKPFHINKVYKDDYWEGPNNIFKKFDELNLNWHLDKTEYQKDKDSMMPVRKIWNFTIWFDNNKDKQQKINGYIVASGMGRTEDPLEKYDVVVVMT